MDISTPQWLLTIAVVPISTFSAAFLANHSQNKRVDDSEKRMVDMLNGLEKLVNEKILSTNAMLNKIESNLKEDNRNRTAELRDDLKGLRTDIKGDLSEIRKAIAALARGQAHGAGN